VTTGPEPAETSAILLAEQLAQRLAQQGPLGEALTGLLRRVLTLPPSDVAAAVSEEAHVLGAEEVVIYLVDYAMSTLVPVPSPYAADRVPLSINTTLAGRAFRDLQVSEGDGEQPGKRRIWAPILDGLERLGVLEMCFPDTGDGLSKELEHWCALYAALVAELIVSRRAYGDVFEFVRRRQAMSVPAEMQWRILPPLTFGTDAFVISGALEPCYEVGGDAFDYAVNGDDAFLAVFDAMGHGLAAATQATVAVGAYRNARRGLLDLVETYRSIDKVLSEHSGPELFVTAILAHLDIASGRFSWLGAGHPPPMLLRNGRLVRTGGGVPSLPLGLNLKPDIVQVGTWNLEPGDRIVLYTDGIVEAKRGDDVFGIERLGDFLVKESAGGLPAPETLRRLTRAVLDHQSGHLQDDATILLLDWAGRPSRPGPL